MRISFICLVLLLFLVGSFATHAQQATPTPSPEDQDRIYSAKEVDVKAKLRPTTDVPQPGRDCFELDYPRVVVLKVVLRKSGVVSDVTLVKKSGCSYDKDAIRVAGKIKFEPARKHGQDVSQYLTVEYAYEKP
jgi:TonB family protein